MILKAWSVSSHYSRFILPENIRKPKVTLIISEGRWYKMATAWNKVFHNTSQGINYKYILVQNTKPKGEYWLENQKKFRTEILTPFFVSCWNKLCSSLTESFVFLFVIKKYVYCSPGGMFFSWFFEKITREIGTVLVL